MGAKGSNEALLAFGLAPFVRCNLVGRTRMTAGNVDLSDTDGNTSPIRPAKQCRPSPSQKIENRPELVGGLPLWLTMGAVTQMRRLAEMLNFTPFAWLRKYNVEAVESKIVRSQSSAKQDLPVGRALRKIADAMEEELASLRMSLEALKTELSQSQAESSTLRKRLHFLKLKNARNSKMDSEKALSSTASHLRFLLCKEQTRAAAAEKKLAELERRLKAGERHSSLIAGDFVKISLLYTSLAAVFIGFLADSPFGPQILHHMMSGGH